jgi:hypothetical protein
MPRPALPASTGDWPHRELLLQRQQALLLRSADLRRELAAELSSGWQAVETPVNLLLRLLELLGQLRQGAAGLRAQHPWLAMVLVPMGWPALRWLWRRLRRKGAQGSVTRTDQDDTAASADQNGSGRRQASGRLARLLRTLHWARRGFRLLRLLQGRPTPRG